MRLAVAQLGARRNYAVPVVLAAAGMLERFYTDVAGNAAWVRHLQRPLSRLPRNNPLARLAARRLPAEVRDKATTFPIRSLAHAVALRLLPTPERRFRAHLRHTARLGEGMARHGYGNATHVYSMLGECGPFLEQARRRGLVVVSDVYIRPRTVAIVAAERGAHPDWEPEPIIVPERTRRALGMEDHLMAHTDYFVCPSQVVREDLAREFGIPPSRAAVVPHGVDARWLALAPRTEPRRILFAGSADLRKGIHHLAAAALRLHTRGFRYQFRIAGDASATVRSQPACRHLTFLGRVPRRQMPDELVAADVLVLPTLAEGSALVTYEALAAGVPVVTTRAAGSMVRDGIDGSIVPERDPEALALAIAEIVEDRGRRARMSMAARERAREFTWERYGERLVAALRSFGA
jgi:glycosyltransferase involved in cell wall biosynthesis